MKINTTVLADILNNLPTPTHNGQIHHVALRERFAPPLRRALDQRRSVPRITFVAVMYAMGKHQRWLEWELLTEGD